MKLKYLYIWLMGLLAIGCFDDDTTVDTVRISEVAIDTNSLQKEYNRDKNQTLVIDITPYVTQKEKNLPLTFQWDMDYKFYSDSSVLYVDYQELGTFPMRVKVSNEHSSAFYEFKLHINSPYEEGIAVLSESNDGTGMLSFMRQMADGSMGDFEMRCLSTNNHGIVFPKSPTDMSKRLSQLFISYKNDPSIYMVNAKTLELENIVTATEFSDFVPVAMMMPDNTARAAIALSENGKVYNLASMEGLILSHTALKSTYSLIHHGYFDDYNPAYYLWDTDLHTICYYNGYTVNDCSQFGAIWDENHEVVAIFENEKRSSFTVLTRKNGEIWKTSLGNYIYLQDPDTYQSVGIDYRDVQRVIANPVLEKENPKVPFYTLEVEPDGTIRQKRAEFNRQNKDIDKVTSFLTLWQKEIQKRLTQKDRKSTEESRKLRQQNYQEIRDKHVVVHGGTFAGELLADLLEKDLMDLPMESAENEESPTEIAA